MITTTTSCDRCGRQHHDPHGMPDLEGDKLSPFGALFDDVHLCGRCTRAFKAWLEAGPRPDDPGEPEPGPIKIDPRSERSRRGRR
jgi:hypothetical protein